MKQEFEHIVKGIFMDIPGIECEILELHQKRNNEPDVVLTIDKGGAVKNYYLEFKTKVLPAQVPDWKHYLNMHNPTILVAQYITTEAKKMLQKENIPYIDTAGNVYINDDNFYILIETNKTNRAEIEVNTNRAFYKTGLKVTYQFLLHPEYLNEPYRFIGQQATVTIDTVRRVFQGLLKDNFIVKTNKKTYQFTDRKHLFQEWVTTYNKNLRPKLKNRKFSWVDNNIQWKNIKLPKDTLWGGEAAAELITDYLIANKFTIYTARPYQDLIQTLKIVPQPNGNITVIEKFWNDNNEDYLVHPILVYADLINEPNPRNLETATKIYENHVKNIL